MSRYIDAEQAIAFLARSGNREYRRTKGTIQEAVKALMYDEYTPTVDVKPVIRGEWEPVLIPTGVSAFGVDEMTAECEKCTACGYEKPIECFANFCPNCGADMRGDADDKD